MNLEVLQPMNWMALLATIFGTTAIGLFVWARKLRQRKHDLETRLHIVNANLGTALDMLEKQGRVVEDYLEAADLMNDCNVQLERRNFYLESKRNVILARWWRRRRGQHRQLVSWQVRKAGGV
jgi:hypothetical protein